MNWIDNSVVRALSRICDLVILNILWIICSLPIITIGASTSAMYSVMLKIVKNEEGYIARGFFRGFKDNFRKATILWGTILVVGVIVGVDLRVIRAMPSTLQSVFRGVLIFVGFMMICLNIYGFAMIARYENKLKETIKNAFILTIMKLPYTILMIVITIAPIILTFLSARLLVIGMIFWLVIGVALVAWANSFILRKVFLIFHDEVEKNECEN